jgi:hypothetical protein
MARRSILFPLSRPGQAGRALRCDNGTGGEEEEVGFGEIELGLGFGDAVGAGKEQAGGVNEHRRAGFGLGEDKGCGSG